MTIKDIKKLIHMKNFAWLINCAKPFKWLIISITSISMISAVFGVGSAVLSKQMIDNAIWGNTAQTIFYIVLFVVAQAIILGTSALSGKLAVQLNEKMSYRTEQDIIKGLYKSDWMSYNKYHSGDILMRLTNDISNATTLWVSTLPGIIALGLQLILAFVILLYYDSTLALFAFFLGPISIIISFLLGQRLKKLQHKIQTAESRHRSYVTELIQHMLIIKSFEHEEKSLEGIAEKQADKYQCVVKRNNMSITANLVLSGGYWAGYVLAFVYGVFKLAKQTATFGTFTAFIQLVGQIQEPFIGLARSIPQMVSSLASVERLMELESIKNESATNETIDIKGKRIGLVFEDVSFGYNPENKVLLDISLRVDPINIIALIGSSGEGKTTLMRLLLALLKPDSGSMYIDIDGKERIPVSAGTRGYFTYVPQGNTLFSGTIMDNLRIGKPDATSEEMKEALKAACSWDFVQESEDKLNSILGEGGLGLSEGQAQRLCIARALIRPSPVLLLDEATSALDMETEKKIFDNIRRIHPRKTCIVITHRLSVLPLCDRVYRLENGKLYEHDTHDFSNILLNEQIS